MAARASWALSIRSQFLISGNVWSDYVLSPRDGTVLILPNEAYFINPLARLPLIYGGNRSLRSPERNLLFEFLARPC